MTGIVSYCCNGFRCILPAAALQGLVSSAEIKLQYCEWNPSICCYCGFSVLCLIVLQLVFVLANSYAAGMSLLGVGFVSVSIGITVLPYTCSTLSLLVVITVFVSSYQY